MSVTPPLAVYCTFVISIHGELDEKLYRKMRPPRPWSRRLAKSSPHYKWIRFSSNYKVGEAAPATDWVEAYATKLSLLVTER
jgi:hypothetical protein